MQVICYHFPNCLRHMQLLAIHCMMQKGVPNPTGSWYMLKPSVALINWHKIFYCNVKLSHKVFSADGALLGFISQGAHLLSGKITVYSCWKAIKTERAPQVKNASLISPASDHLTRSILFFPHQIFGRSEGIYWCWCSYSTAQSGNLSEGYAARAPLIWKFETTTWLFSLQRCTWFLTPLSEFSSFSKVFCLDPWPHIHW